MFLNISYNQWDMTKNPYINAFCSLGYIVLVGLVMNFISHTQNNKPDTFLAPVAILSLLTLSAALMGYFFLYQPVLLYLDGKKKQATSLFMQTVLVFAGITAGVFIVLLSGVIK